MRTKYVWVVAVAITLFYCTFAHAMSAREYYALAQNQKGINAFGATVQSALETGHWTSPMWRNTYNGAGIKADTQWRKTKSYVEFESPESKNGIYFKKVSYFKKYETPSVFLVDYAQKIKRDYPQCTADNFFGYFAGLYNGRLGKWATDHRYFEKLVRKAVAFETLLLTPGHLKRSFEYAKDKNYLEPWQIKIIEEVIK
jgi:hypothetical protein